MQTKDPMWTLYKSSSILKERREGKAGSSEIKAPLLMKTFVKKRGHDGKAVERGAGVEAEVPGKGQRTSRCFCACASEQIHTETEKAREGVKVSKIRKKYTP